MKALFAALVLLGSAAQAGEGFKARGFILPDGAVKIDEDRYRLSQPWDEAVKFYRRAYPPAKYPRHNLRSQSPVRAVHIENRSGGEWDGANLYEASRGEVRLYILAAKEETASPATGGGRRQEHPKEETASPATGGGRRPEHPKDAPKAPAK